MKTNEDKKKDVKQIKAIMRNERIDILGGFGNKREHRMPDITKYTRKEKHKKA